jgi:hypothetical protein
VQRRAPPPVACFQEVPSLAVDDTGALQVPVAISAGCYNMEPSGVTPCRSEDAEDAELLVAVCSI